MQYKYEKQLKDYSDLASGRVFYSLPGHPAFPVRLASEIFQRCMASRARVYGEAGLCTLYDPFCGAAYHLSVLGYLHGEHIREIIASDIDEKAIALAERNLGLLGAAGLERRIGDITAMLEQYNKESHKEALASAYTLKNKIAASDQPYPLVTRVFQAGATDRRTILKNIPPASVDIVFSDIPYGQHSQWQGTSELTNPLESTLEALLDILSPASILAIASDKQQKASHEQYQRVEQFHTGKRRVILLRPVQHNSSGR